MKFHSYNKFVNRSILFAEYIQSIMPIEEVDLESWYLWLLVPNSTCFSPYLSNPLENENFTITQTWIGSF